MTISANFIAAQVKTPQPVAAKPVFAGSLQAVLVTTSDWDAASGTATLFERRTPKDKWKKNGKPISVVLGRSGMAWGRDSAPENATEFKQEGDGRSPAGLIPLTFAFGAAERPAGSMLSYMRFDPSTECVDDPGSSHYNKIVDRFKVGNFDWKSSEKMLEVGEEYEFGIFAAYNSYPVRKGDGSCIFLHIWKNSTTPTSGCTAMAKDDLIRIINWLQPDKNPYLVQLPMPEYKRLKKGWQLP